LLTPRACGAASLMARRATPDVGHRIYLFHGFNKFNLSFRLMKLRRTHKLLPLPTLCIIDAFLIHLLSF
jgi:hypothetical protein